MYYSQWKQDEYLDKVIFKGKSNGIFIDIGAHDGISLSNTYYFEKNLNWTGLCIEPHKDVFTLLKKNRNCYLENVAISDSEKNVKYLKISGAPEMLSGLVDNYDPRHIERITNETINNGGSIDIVDMKCVSLNSLLEKYNINHIDYMSIDVEGAELDILKGINFNKYDINYITIEDNYPDSSSEWHNLLKKNNYKAIQVLGHDYVYTNL
jgi:FkbM family methyltransferase